MGININLIQDNNPQPSIKDIETFTDAEAKKFLSELKRYDENTVLRQSLSHVFTTVICVWLVCVLFIVANNYNKFYLSENVLITLLTTTTIQVLGMMYIILKDLFPGGNTTT